ncbi:MAG: hypothetical protein AMXMBFR34_51580 [Myxococcaceae bacterium]
MKQWGRVLHDDDLGDAIVDRILERGRVLKLDGPSVRSKHVNQADLERESQLQPPAGVSGTHTRSMTRYDIRPAHPRRLPLPESPGLRPRRVAEPRQRRA